MPATIFPKQNFPASPTELPLTLSLSREGEGTHALALAPVELEVLPMAFKENLCNFLLIGVRNVNATTACGLHIEGKGEK